LRFCSGFNVRQVPYVSGSGHSPDASAFWAPPSCAVPFDDEKKKEEGVVPAGRRLGRGQRFVLFLQSIGGRNCVNMRR